MREGVRFDRAASFATLVLLGLMSMGLYERKQRLRFRGIVTRERMSFAVVALALTSIYSLFPPVAMSRYEWELGYRYGSTKRDIREKLDFDVYCFKHESMIFAIMTLSQAVGAVLWDKGARSTVLNDGLARTL